MQKIFLILLVFVVLFAEAKPTKSRRKRGPQCGLPTFIEDLPSDAQDRLNEIWEEYQEGDDCEEEQAKTRELVGGLLKEVQENLENVSKLPFLRGIPKRTLRKFISIFKDKSIPFSEKLERIEELAERELTGDNLRKFKEYKKKKDREAKKFSEREEELSPNAKAAHEKIEKLQKRKFEILAKLTAAEKQELLDLWEFRPRSSKS